MFCACVSVVSTMHISQLAKEAITVYWMYLAEFR